MLKGATNHAYTFTTGQAINFKSPQSFPEYGLGPFIVLSVFSVPSNRQDGVGHHQWVTFYKEINGSRMIFSPEKRCWHLPDSKLLVFESCFDRDLTPNERFLHGPAIFSGAYFKPIN